MAKKYVILTALCLASIEELTKAFAESKPEDVAFEIIQLKDDYEAAAKKAADAFEGLKKQLDSLKLEHKATVELNKELTEKVEELAASQTISIVATEKEKSFTVDKVKYGFLLHKLRHKGNVITSDDVVVSKELQADLIAMKSGMIRKED